jgi:Rab guanine nucleotide exchange factor SEC2
VDGLRPGTPAAESNTNPGPGVDPSPKEADEDKVEGDEEHTLRTDEATKATEEEEKEKESEGGGVDVSRLEPPVEMEVVDEKEKIIEQEQEQEQQTVEEEQKEDEKDDTPDREVVADTEKAADGNDRDWEEVQAEDVDGDQDVTSVEEKTVKSLEVKDLKPNENDEAFIGDATWEERTWKELVRLREEMFWARIGALRQ